jgi:hypothetical protein
MPLPVVVPLPVSAPAQTRLRKDLIVDLPVFLQRNFVVVDLEFARELRRNIVGEFVFPEGITDFHEGTISSMSIKITIFSDPAAVT